MLAQLVEQLAFNQLVTGSNPVHPTINFHNKFHLKAYKNNLLTMLLLIILNNELVKYKSVWK